MSVVYLGIGSNIGNCLNHIEKSLEALDAILGNIRRAPIYKTKALDYTKQSDFLNTVVCGTTQFSPENLLDEIQSIEKAGGRKRDCAILKGPRTIDIDILLYGDMILSSDKGRSLQIPHREMHRRLFVLKPLLDISEELADPRDGVLWSLKASSLTNQEVVPYGK